MYLIDGENHYEIVKADVNNSYDRVRPDGSAKNQGYDHLSLESGNTQGEEQFCQMWRNGFAAKF